MKVCWLSNYFSPYKLKLLELVSKSVDLTCVILGGTDDEHRNKEWTIKENNNFKLYVIDKEYSKLIKELAKENDVLIDSMYSTPYGYLAVSAFRKEHKKIIMHADGGIPIDRGFIVNKILSILMKRHNIFMSSGPHCDKYYNFYGIENKDIKHYRFSSLTNSDLNKNEKMLQKKKEYRKELGIDDKFTLISVGKPVKGKGFDILTKAYLETNKVNDINLYIIGGEPEQEIKEFVETNNLKNVHFVGLLGSEELKKYYAACDSFILCTRTDVWGLVILEAMSFGLPVITSNNCGAGVHFNLLSECVATCGIEDVEGYSNKIKELYNDRNRTLSLGKEALKVVNEYTIENSAQDIINILNTI